MFLSLSCVLGLFGKRLIAPAGNLITDLLHIPGGVNTAFSLMFITIGCSLVPFFGCGTLMGLVQGLLALALGRVGSMGILSPIGYTVPGLIIDLVMLLGRKVFKKSGLIPILANMLGSVSAALTADIIVFRLPLAPLFLYLMVGALFGAVFGLLASMLIKRLKPVIKL